MKYLSPLIPATCLAMVLEVAATYKMMSILFKTTY